MSEAMFPRPVAHRGLHDRAAGIIENSASAFGAAIAGDFAIECDVQLTSDGVPVIFHDDGMKRLLGLPGLVADTASATVLQAPLIGSENGDCPQRFSEFLAQIGGRTLLQIELKRQRNAAGTLGLARAVAEGLKTYHGPVTVQALTPSTLIAKRRVWSGPISGPASVVPEVTPSSLRHRSTAATVAVPA